MSGDRHDSDNTRQPGESTASSTTAAALSHVDAASGRLRMVDISDKRHTQRTARARGRVTMAEATAALVAADEVPKGNVLACAQIAGLQAAKRTAELIPLCHPLRLTFVDVALAVEPNGVAIEAIARSADATGVEMEALTAVSVAALCIYDMCKAVDKAMRIEGVRLVEKLGGRSGHYLADGADGADARPPAADEPPP